MRGASSTAWKSSATTPSACATSARRDGPEVAEQAGAACQQIKKVLSCRRGDADVLQRTGVQCTVEPGDELLDAVAAIDRGTNLRRQGTEAPFQQAKQHFATRANGLGF